VDVAQDEHGQRVFLLAQSYMPAQDIHVLKNPGSNSPWYPARLGKTLVTPEWVFQPPRLMRFPDREGCGLSEAVPARHTQDRAARDDTRSASYQSDTSGRPK